LGYVEGNVVPCCKDCNRAKWDLTVTEFADSIRRIHAHLELTKWDTEKET